MKKSLSILTIILAVAALVGLMSTPAMAVQGRCDNCHTMHNSQGGTNMSMGTPTDAKEYLLRGTCIGCHSVTDTSNFNSVDAPAVLNTVEPTAGVLAGGNFFWVDPLGGNNEVLGHNVDMISTTRDTKFAGNPPGWDSTYRASATAWTANQLTCAGTYGCHGDPAVAGSYAGIKGAHHSNATGSITGTPTATGPSYRFLYGIAGVEDDDYEQETSTDKNFYMGAVKGASEGSGVNTNTISYSCATCHGEFHDRDTVGGTASPWIRHPTDMLLPTTSGTEYALYDPTTTGYVNEAPVAWLDPAVPVRAGAVVMCLSCHRAHGMGDVAGANDAQYADILRFPYDGQVAGGTAAAGCMTCHNTK